MTGKWKHFLRFFRLQWAQKLKQPIYLRLVEGLTGEASTVSFESTSRPGYYLCRAGNKIIIVRLNSSNSQMKKDCTFRAYSDQFFEGYVSFEVAEEPDLWVRQSNRQLQVSNINTYRQGDSSKGMERCLLCWRQDSEGSETSEISPFSELPEFVGIWSNIGFWLLSKNF